MGRNVLIINLTRMGDLLQSTPLMESLKEDDRDTFITLLVNSSFSKVCEGIPVKDELIEFDISGLREGMTGGNVDIVGSYRKVEGLIKRINRRHYDLTINLTHSPLSAILTSLVDTDEVRGFTIDGEGHRIIRHPWMRYFFNVVPNRQYNPFHIVDMYLMVGGVGAVSRKLLYYPGADDTSKADELLQAHGVRDDDILVGLQMGASKQDRRWPVANFACVADLIADTYGARIVLFGSSAEADLADEFAEHARTRPVNLIGKTSIGELAAILSRCSLLIGNDTGTIHVATASGTKVLGIFSVNAHYMETGPYGEGHYVIEADLPCMPCGFDTECKNRLCRNVVKPEAVYAIARHILDGERGAVDQSLQVWEGVRVMRSFFDEDGMLDYEPVVRRKIGKEDLLRIFYRNVWAGEFDDRDGSVDAVSTRIREYVSSRYMMGETDELSESIHEDAEIAEKLLSLATEGLDHLEEIASEAGRKKPDIERIKAEWQEVERIECMIDTLANTNPFLRPLVILFRYSREAMEGEGIKELSGAACLIYRELIFYTTRLVLLMKKTKEVMQPVAAVETIEYRDEQESGTPWYL
jgi:ADP-heptose:LPS heptosyltransferase